MTQKPSTLIRNRKRQGSIFNALKQTRSLLMMYSPGRKQQGLTQIIDKNLHEEELLFDIPNDATLVAGLSAGISLTVEGALQGVPVFFETRVIRMDRHEGDDVLVCEWPVELDYQQRRNAFRVQIPLSMESHVLWFREGVKYHAPEDAMRVAAGEELLHESRASDLSIQGVCMECELRGGECPDVGDTLMIRQLRIGNQQWSDIRAEVRTVQALGGASLIRLGVLFLDLSPSVDRSLNRLLMELQYDAARRV
ncbi:hypothetical protein CKO35_01720 [Ectothiorhodospira shaposhnikovii]|uniref:flagellar brake protein n=1 Tax=Ectothiorhodospira shaposhnikovii TaxID=1054 RepID=UPI00190691FF|nr:flagellar brake protein [Ectothiorhodospira shaposhnikovii]MBK1672034.1 hypothetical protein [Ectothiorhodospira shaposhnikovii]